MKARRLVLALASAAAIGGAAWAWHAAHDGRAARLPVVPARPAAPRVLLLKGEGLHWSAAVVVRPGPPGEEGALYLAIDLRQEAGPAATRYRVTASLPAAAYACRRDGPAGAAPPGPWTAPSSEPTGPSGVLHLPACRLDLAGRSEADGFALLRANPLFLQVEWQAGREIRVEVIEVRPA